MGGIDTNVDTLVKTQFQLKAHESFATHGIAQRNPMRLVSDGRATKLLAKPPAWTELPGLLCVPLDEFTESTSEGWGKHWDTNDDSEAASLCAGCPAITECRNNALEEERGLHHQFRFMVRGGLTPRGRWVLDGVDSA